jgi:hypothetical protein
MRGAQHSLEAQCDFDLVASFVHMGHFLLNALRTLSVGTLDELP